MSTSVLISDDSSFARKQMARALPREFAADITFAVNGLEALDAVRAGKAEILFLDLNMPVMDGYEVLAAVREQELSVLVIVVSGDVQPEARARVMKLGALELIKKPIDEQELREVLDRYGIHGQADAGSPSVDVQVDIIDGIREIANVAMGRSADLLARLLDVFVVMAIPNVNLIEPTELEMALDYAHDGEKMLAVCQGFIGAGLAGEALLLFDESSYEDIAALMHVKDELTDGVRLGLLMDIANVLIGACLKGISDQLDISFSQGHPVVLGRHVNVASLLARNNERWHKMLAIEMGYRIENRRIQCNLLLLFTEDSLARLSEFVSYLAD